MSASETLQVACRSCGAILEYRPDAAEVALTCRYCGASQPLGAEPAIDRSDFQQLLQASLQAGHFSERAVLDCGTCGAQTTLGEGVIAERCPFCGNPSVVPGKNRLLRPAAVLPFSLDEKQARAAVVEWERDLWFKPAKRLGPADGDWRMHAVYLPYWSFDWVTTTEYVGERGKKVDKDTKWSAVKGTVVTKLGGSKVFGSRSVSRDHGAELEPWEESKVVAFRDEFLQGLHAETSTLAIPDAASLAQKLLARQIEYDVKCDIGGDDQRIQRQEIRYDAAQAQLQLLPVWITHFESSGKRFRVLINGNTGEVIGERPISRARLRAFALAPLLLGLVCAVILPGLLSWHPIPSWRAPLACFWGGITGLGVLSFIGGSIAAARRRGRSRHGELFVSRKGPGTQGLQLDPAAIWNGALQSDVESRGALFQALGFCGLFVGMFPFLSTAMFDDFLAPVLMMHGFAAVGVAAFVWATRVSFRDRMSLLGLD